MMDIRSLSLSDLYGLARGLFGGPTRAEHFDMESIFGSTSRESLRELEIEALRDPFGVASSTDLLLDKWAQMELTAPEVRTPLGFLTALDGAIGALRQGESQAQSPADAAAMRQALRELSAYHANAMVGWEGANALQAG